jgi:hypothetical protein
VPTAGRLPTGASTGFSSRRPGQLTATSPSYEAIIVWWMDVILAILVVGASSLLVLTGFEKRVLTRLAAEPGSLAAAAPCPCAATLPAGLTRS